MFDRDSIQRKFGHILQEVVKELSKCIEVITVEPLHGCPNCYIDTVTGKSSGVCKHGPELDNYFQFGRCPVCKGEGVIDYESKVYVNASVIWKGSSSGSRENDLVFDSFGTAGLGMARLKIDICYLNLFKSCDFIIVDGVKCTLYNPPIIQGLGGKHIMLVYVHAADKTNNDETIKTTSAF